MHLPVPRHRDSVPPEPSISGLGARTSPAYISLVKLSCRYLVKTLNGLVNSPPTEQRLLPTRPQEQKQNIRGEDNLIHANKQLTNSKM